MLLARPAPGSCVPARHLGSRLRLPPCVNAVATHQDARHAVDISWGRHGVPFSSAPLGERKDTAPLRRRLA